MKGAIDNKSIHFPVINQMQGYIVDLLTVIITLILFIYSKF